VTRRETKKETKKERKKERDRDRGEDEVAGSSEELEVRVLFLHRLVGEEFRLG